MTVQKGLRILENKKAGDLLKDFSSFFESKNSDSCYGDSYLFFGDLMDKLFPEGILIKGKDSFNKFGIFSMIVHKMIRTSKVVSNQFKYDFEKPFDNARDLSIYSAMLAEVFQDE